jgi:two-component system sensor histidine kinase BaeS
LALAFVVVAFGAVAVLAGLTLAATRSQTSGLTQAERSDTTRGVVAALAQAYREAGGWASADLRPAVVLAVSAGARLQVLDRQGVAVQTPALPMPMMNGMHAAGGPLGAVGPPVRVAVVVDGTGVGTAVLRFPTASLSPAAQTVRAGLERTVLLGAGLAALLALGVAWYVSRRITRPLVQLTGTVRAIESGRRAARAGLAGAPGEVGELAEAFDRMADALDREDALRRQLAADVAHELRTPVSILQAYCEEMIDGLMPASLERLVSLRDEVLRLGRLVEDLQTLSAAEAAGLRLERQPVDLARVAGEVADLIAPRFAAEEVSLSVQLQPVMVAGDPARLRQVVTNLLTNALKFTPAGGRVVLSVGADGSLAKLEVADTGPGIPPEELEHVFERFWRGSAGRRSGGSGIGLAVVAELVRAHGGRVAAASDPSGGARLTVLIPSANR